MTSFSIRKDTNGDNSTQVVTAANTDEHFIISSILLEILGISGASANVVNLVIFIKYTKSFSPHNHLVFNLGLSDIFISVWGIVLGAVQLRYGNVELLPCSFIFLWSFLLFIHMFQFSVLTMTIEHYIAIFKPLQFKVRFTQASTRKIIILTWILSLFIALCGLPQTLYTYIVQKTNFCDAYLQGIHIEHYITSVSIGILIVLTVILNAYLLMNSSHHLSKYCHSNSTEDNCSRRHRKLIYITGLIFVVFVICWIPLHCLYLVLLSQGVSVLPKSNLVLLQMRSYAMSLPMLHSLLDAVICALRMPEIQKGYQHICRTYRPSDTSNVQLSML